MRVVPRYKALHQALPRRLRWTRARIPTRRHVPVPYRPEGRAVARPSARVSLLHLLATLVVAGVVWGTGTLFARAYAGRIYPHVTIDHVPVGGMTRDEALAALRYSETARINTAIYVQAGGETWQVTPAQLGARYDIMDAVDRALALAHGGPFVLGGWDELQTIWRGANVPLSGTHTASAVTGFLAKVARMVHQAPRSAAVGVRGDDVAIVRHAVDGRQLDLPGAVAALGAVVNTHDSTAVTLPLQPVTSALGDDEAQAAVDKAQALLAAPIQFQWTTGSTRSWLLTKSGMLRLLTFRPHCAKGVCRFDMGINIRKLAEAFNLGGVTVAVDQPPTPASYILYQVGDPRLSSVRVTPDFPGSVIDVQAAANGILRQANVASGSRVILLPILPLHAAFTAADATALNFNEVVGYSGSTFAGVDWARRDDLNVAANVISSTLVQPNQTFRLAVTAGPLDKAHGYRPGQNVVGPGDITGVNGGVTLLASTVLAAAFDAGLPIVQRVHYPYLNAYTPLGFDAVVSYEKKKRVADLVVRNTTDHAILIMTSNDGQGEASIYIFNNAGHAPGGLRGAYSSTTSGPQVTLNPDGSVDTTITRSVAVNGRAAQDKLSSHYAPIDP